MVDWFPQLQEQHNDTSVDTDSSRDVCEVCHGSLVHLEDPCDREANPKICYLMKLQGHVVVITNENACNRKARWHKTPCKLFSSGYLGA